MNFIKRNNLFLNTIKLINNKRFVTNTTKHVASQLSNDKIDFSSESIRKRIPQYLCTQIDDLTSEMNHLKQMSDENNDRDNEMTNLINAEMNQLSSKMENLKNLIIDSLCNSEIINDSIVEVRAGVGGREAMIFAREMFDVYCRLCSYMSWKWHVMSEDNDIESGGLRIISFVINGDNCYGLMRHESGVHRVQRVPKTEKSGRIHTSTITVSVIPIKDKFSGIVLNPNDLEFEMKTSSGAGGQHVNKTKSCVRVTHVPTGVTAECQEQRSQIQNKETAIKRLESQLNQMELERRQKEEIESKKSQIGNAARSDKLRTYNFIQDRITDHRLSDNVYDIDELMKGNGEKIFNLIMKLEDQRKREIIKQIIM